jgi:hypothetical protein
MLRQAKMPEDLPRHRALLDLPEPMREGQQVHRRDERGENHSVLIAQRDGRFKPRVTQGNRAPPGRADK